MFGLWVNKTLCLNVQIIIRWNNSWEMRERVKTEEVRCYVALCRELIISRLQASPLIIISLLNVSYHLAGSLIKQLKWLIALSFTFIYSCLYSCVCPSACMQTLIATACSDLAGGGGTCTSSWTAAEAAALWCDTPRVNLNHLCAAQQAVFNHD